MVQSLQLGDPSSLQSKAIRRLNKLPVLLVIGLAIVFFGVIIFGLSSRGLYPRQTERDDSAGVPAANYADQLKRGIQDGIIGEPELVEPLLPPPVSDKAPKSVEDKPVPETPQPAFRGPVPETPDDFEARLVREGRERYLREIQRRKLARMQADEAARASPLQVDISQARLPERSADPARDGAKASDPVDLYQAALQAGLAGRDADQNKQGSKEDFFNADIKEFGYLPNKVVPQLSRYELKRGSVIPAILITGINSDLPGRISAQVSQAVYDSATGHQLLIPQGAKLFGRYDSKVAFGQARVLVVWTDIIFPNGSTLQIGGMAGTDAQGYGGFEDRVNNHTVRTFASAALIALIGTGIDASMPESSTRDTQDTASDAARRNFAESFGRVAERSIDKGLNLQPTLKIRPGYMFSVLVDQDIVFPGAYVAR
jgi:type IV secretion system protein VirB10